MPKETWKNAKISNNLLFQQVMRDKAICKRFLEKLLGISIAEISVPESEKQIAGKPGAKESRLDVYVKDKDGTAYDIEMQTTDYKAGDIAKRSRYYQAQLDLDSLLKGESYRQMRQSYVIFVCTFDPFGAKRRIYTFRSRCDEDCGLALDDGAARIFLNAEGTQGNADAEIVKFLEYVRGRPPAGKLATDMSEKAEEIKQGKKWRLDYMNWEMELLCWGEHVAEKTEKKVVARERLEVIRRLAAAKQEIGVMAAATGLTAKQVAALAKKHKIAL